MPERKKGREGYFTLEGSRLGGGRVWRSEAWLDDSAVTKPWLGDSTFGSTPQVLNTTLARKAARSHLNKEEYNSVKALDSILDRHKPADYDEDDDLESFINAVHSPAQPFQIPCTNTGKRRVMEGIYKHASRNLMRRSVSSTDLSPHFYDDGIRRLDDDQEKLYGWNNGCQRDLEELLNRPLGSEENTYNYTQTLPNSTGSLIDPPGDRLSNPESGYSTTDMDSVLSDQSHAARDSTAGRLYRRRRARNSISSATSSQRSGLSSGGRYRGNARQHAEGYMSDREGLFYAGSSPYSGSSTITGGSQAGISDKSQRNITSGGTLKDPYLPPEDSSSAGGSWGRQAPWSGKDEMEHRTSLKSETFEHDLGTLQSNGDDENGHNNAFVYGYTNRFITGSEAGEDYEENMDRYQDRYGDMDQDSTLKSEHTRTLEARDSVTNPYNNNPTPSYQGSLSRKHRELTLHRGSSLSEDFPAPGGNSFTVQAEVYNRRQMSPGATSPSSPGWAVSDQELTGSDLGSDLGSSSSYPEHPGFSYPAPSEAGSIVRREVQQKVFSKPANDAYYEEDPYLQQSDRGSSLPREEDPYLQQSDRGSSLPGASETSVVRRPASAASAASEASGGWGRGSTISGAFSEDSRDPGAMVLGSVQNRNSAFFPGHNQPDNRASGISEMSISKRFPGVVLRRKVAQTSSRDISEMSESERESSGTLTEQNKHRSVARTVSENGYNDDDDGDDDNEGARESSYSGARSCAGDDEISQHHSRSDTDVSSERGSTVVTSWRRNSTASELESLRVPPPPPTNIGINSRPNPHDSVRSQSQRFSEAGSVVSENFVSRFPPMPDFIPPPPPNFIPPPPPMAHLASSRGHPLAPARSSSYEEDQRSVSERYSQNEEDDNASEYDRQSVVSGGSRASIAHSQRSDRNSVVSRSSGRPGDHRQSSRLYSPIPPPPAMIPITSRITRESSIDEELDRGEDEPTGFAPPPPAPPPPPIFMSAGLAKVVPNQQRESEYDADPRPAGVSKFCAAIQAVQLRETDAADEDSNLYSAESHRPDDDDNVETATTTTYQPIPTRPVAAIKPQIAVKPSHLVSSNNKPTVSIPAEAVTSDGELRLEALPGYQSVPDGCPDWKRAMIENKNAQLQEQALKQLEEDKKWKDVPAWKRDLIDKKKNEEQLLADPSVGVKNLRQPMPAWLNDSADTENTHL